MKIFLSFLLACTFWVASAAEPIKVACVGNSITYGAGVVDREKNSYPAQLQEFLGPEYEVRNFGINSRTLLRRGDLPYVETDTYKESQAFGPDIVLIKLGTNDSKPQNRIYLESDYKRDYAALIDSYRDLPSHPRIVLLTPVRCYLSEDQFSTRCYLDIIIPALEELACEKNCEIINLYSLFDPEWSEYLLPDKLHPSSIGAGMLAEKIGRYIIRRDTVVSPADRIPYPVQTFGFHGFEGRAFDAFGAECRVVVPKRAAPGLPWVWRARFWGHEPQTDIALLEQGFHLVYCDVADLYGSPRAVARWNKFYGLMIRLGLNCKPVLEAMSRGGLIAYNWAAANPSKVSCIYADAPVLNPASWPMGKGSGEGSADDTRKLLSAYGFRDEAAALRWRGNPLDHACKLGRAGIPMLHVVGDADTVVPVAENTALFEEAVRRCGGTIRVIHKPRVGHHPHSLSNPQPIVDFILAACGRPSDRCVRPVPGNEYRSAAGWSEGSDWHAVAEDISSVLAGRPIDVLLVGNSITQGFGGSRRRVVYKPGKEAADRVFDRCSWESAGISGDCTQHVLWRLIHGNYAAAEPKVAVITIGINNLCRGDDPVRVAEGIVAVASEALTRLPGTQILLLGPLPAGREENNPLRVLVNTVHAQLAQTAFDSRITYFNPTEWFTTPDGRLLDGIYAGDDLHLDPPGYRVWCEGMKPLIEKLMRRAVTSPESSAVPAADRRP